MLGDFLSNWSRGWIERFRARNRLAGPDSHSETLWARGPEERLLLHVGCGHATKENTTTGFRSGEWREVRLDADPSVFPDVIGTMVDLSEIPDGAIDAVFSSHGIEHLYWHEVPLALGEFHRVLGFDGFLVVTCPDLQSAAALIAEDRLFDTAYISPAGPITPFDIVYSYRSFVAENPRWMAHHCGFTLRTLSEAVSGAGFKSVYGFRRPDGFDLWVLASKGLRTDSELQALAEQYLVVTP